MTREEIIALIKDKLSVKVRIRDSKIRVALHWCDDYPAFRTEEFSSDYDDIPESG